MIPAILDDARQDLRFAVRSLRREPGLVAGIVATFALAIGANAAMVGLVARLMMATPPGVHDPDALARLRIDVTTADGDRYAMTTTSYPVFRAARALDDAFAGVAAAQSERLTTGRGADLTEISVIAATGDYFRVLGARPAAGRFFDAEDDRLPTGNAVAVLSHAYWQRRYGGSVAALGNRIDVDGVAYTIVGVAPRGFTGDGVAPVDLFVPLSVAQRTSDPGWANETHTHFVSVIARVRSRAAIPAALGRIATSLQTLRNDEQVLSAGLVPFRESDAISPRQLEIARWLAGVSTVVLLVALANVATLLLLRAARRRREIALRVALGAGRGRLARQLLVESGLLSSAGALAALLVARWLSEVVRSTLVPELAPSEQFIAVGTFALTVGTAALLGIVAGLAPLVQAGRRGVAAELQSGRASSGRFGVQRTLIVGQVALCTTLLFGAGLFVESLRRVEAQDLGFSTSHLLVVTLDFRDGLRGQDRDRAYMAAAERLRSLRGVTGATAVEAMPFGSFNVPPISIPGRAEPPSVGGQLPYLYAATPTYLRLMGVKLRRGRLFTESDRRGSSLVVLVNETMARSLWPGQSPLGKCIRVGFDPSVEPSPLAPATLPCREVVGVVGDSRVRSVRATGNEGRLMQYYVPFGQQPEPMMPGASQVNALIVGTIEEPPRMLAAVQRFLQTTTTAPVYARVTPYDDLLDPQIRPWRLGASLFSALGGLALAIAAVGLFAVLSYLVTQRVREIGIRLALGGTRSTIAAFVVGGAMRLVAIGAALGTMAALVLAPLMQSMLFETSTYDVVVIAAVAALLSVVAIAAAAMPAWRASRVSPSVTLLAE